MRPVGTKSLLACVIVMFLITGQARSAPDVDVKETPLGLTAKVLLKSLVCSPDGRRLAFTSGRSGHPEVYIVNIDGTEPDLLTPFQFGDDIYRASPNWSPDGRLVVFESRVNGRFQIETIALRDRTVRQLTSDGINEDPKWAPDSRHVVFTSNRTGVRQLFILDSESGRTRQLTLGGPARLSAWSRALGSP